MGILMVAQVTDCLSRGIWTSQFYPFVDQQVLTASLCFPLAWDCWLVQKVGLEVGMGGRQCSQLSQWANPLSGSDLLHCFTLSSWRKFDVGLSARHQFFRDVTFAHLCTHSLSLPTKEKGTKTFPSSQTRNHDVERKPNPSAPADRQNLSRCFASDQRAKSAFSFSPRLASHEKPKSRVSTIIYKSTKLV